MKRTILILIILLTSIPFSLPIISADTSKPKITVSAKLFDLGKIKSSEVKEYHLTVQNVGKADLIINSVSTDCPCTTFHFLTIEGTPQIDSQIIIPPGEKTELKLTFDSKKTKHVGTFTKLILIGSNDPDEPLKPPVLG